MATDVAAFQRLVRLVARLFYAQDVPPLEELPPEEGVPKRNRPQQAPQPGLGVIVLDALTRREWVQEDYVPKNVEGEPPDPKPPGLAQQLRVHPKLLRRVLRFFEQEQILAREHRRETARRRRRAGDPVPDAAAASMLAGQTVVEEDEETQQRQLTHSYCCIDYPRLVDVLQLRLHLMRTQLKEAEADRKAVQGYACPDCGSSFNSMDAARLLDFNTGEFRCEDCRGLLVQQFDGGQMGDEAERRRRREASRALLNSFDRSIKPLKDLLTRLKDRKPPDFGPLQDWAIEKQKEAERQRRLAAKGGNRGAAAALPQFTNVEVDMGEEEAAAAAAEAAAAVPKVLPPWMLRDGVGSAGASVEAAASQSAEEAAQAAAEREAVERAYVQAWLARANALSGGASADSNQDDKKRPAVDERQDVPESKQMKTEGGWAPVASASPPTVKAEAAAAKPEEDDGQLDWEDADVLPKAAAVPEAALAPTAEAEPAEGEEDIDWEEV